jgi:F-type H+-transporting ATPase subunit epsilon
MRLRITTPTAVVAEAGDVVHLRAEDATGAFGILRGHTDFLTVLATSVISWRRADGTERHCAVRGGVLTVGGGETIVVATREAVLGDDLAHLEAEVLAAFRRRTDEEQTARAGSARLHLAAIRRISSYLRPERQRAGARAPGARPRRSLG